MSSRMRAQELELKRMLKRELKRMLKRMLKKMLKWELKRERAQKRELKRGRLEEPCPVEACYYKRPFFWLKTDRGSGL